MDEQDLRGASTQEIVRRIQGGERDLLELLHDRYAHRLRLLARCRLPRRMRSKLDSVDLVQSTFKDAMEHIDRFRNSRSDGLFLNWLSKILINNLKNKIVRFGRKKADLEREEHLESGGEGMGLDVPEQGPGVASRVGMLEDFERLESVLDDLPDPYREVILLRWFCGMSWDEVGGELECTPAAAKQRELRAQARLIVLWNERYRSTPEVG